MNALLTLAERMKADPEDTEVGLYSEFVQRSTALCQAFEAVESAALVAALNDSKVYSAFKEMVAELLITYPGRSSYAAAVRHAADVCRRMEEAFPSEMHEALNLAAHADLEQPLAADLAALLRDPARGEPPLTMRGATHLVGQAKGALLLPKRNGVKEASKRRESDD